MNLCKLILPVENVDGGVEQFLVDEYNKKQGIYEMHINGQLSFECVYENDIKNGPAANVKNGIKYQYAYVDDKGQGDYKGYDSNNNLRVHGFLKDDKLDGAFKEFDETGKLTALTTYETGKLTALTTYENGVKYGFYKKLDKEGYITERGFFVNDVKIKYQKHHAQFDKQMDNENRRAQNEKLKSARLSACFLGEKSEALKIAHQFHSIPHPISGCLRITALKLKSRQREG